MTAALTTRNPPANNATIRLHATDVTGTRELPVEVLAALPAHAVAQSVASLLSLPSNVRWVLRDDSSSVYLDDETAIGEQIAPETHVSVTPRTHLA